MTFDPPAALIKVIAPVPVPDKEVLDIPEFRVPNHTGSPPQIVNVGPLITPVPDDLPVGSTIIYATTVKDLEKGSAGWQRPAEPTSYDDLTVRHPWIAQADQNFKDALNLAGNKRESESAQHYGQRVHRNFENINRNDGILLAAGAKAEVVVRTDGLEGINRSRPAGSQILDLAVTKDRTLYYVDGKTGRNDIKNSYLLQLAQKLDGKIDKIVAITVKK